MSLSHVLKLASKFVVRGTFLRGAKHLAVKGGRTGIGAFSLIAGGYMAYSLLKKREEWMKEDKQLKKANRSKVVV